MLTRRAFDVSCRPLRTGPIFLLLMSLTVLRAAGPQSFAAPEKKTPGGEMITLGSGADGTSAYLAHPKEPGAHPGVVVLHERWGLTGQIKGVADRLAAAGYVALAPDLFEGKIPGDAGWAHQFEMDLNENRAQRHIRDAVARLRSPEGAGGARVGLLGFGMGGHLALESALAGADIQAAIMFYGKVETSPRTLSKLEVPLLGIFGRDDRVVPREEAEAFRDALKSAGKKATIVVLADAQHGFFNEERPSYNPEDSVGAWAHTTSFFAEHLQLASPAANPLRPAAGGPRR